MARFSHLLVLIVGLWGFVPLCIYANDSEEEIYLDHDTYIELGLQEPPAIDSTLFRTYIRHADNLYEESLRYLHSPISTKRRGVEWWQLKRLNTTAPTANIDYSSPFTQRSARVYSATSQYRVGASIKWGAESKGGWGLLGEVDFKTGRDANIIGVFRNQFSAKLSTSKSFGEDEHLSFTTTLPYIMRGLRSSATQECYTLSGDNLYNPLWGYYNGEVRNSRVVRNLLPTLFARYCRPLSSATIAAISLNAEYGKKRTSRLGWYNTYNPTPNYYTSMPSYLVGTSAYDEAVRVWQDSDTSYTQIGWDELETINKSSSTGDAKYVVEDYVERVCDVDLSLLFTTTLNRGWSVTYGGFAQISSRRNYKQMRDLLGAEYLLDLDQYAGDLIQVGNEMQNNLRSPNRKIKEGERFGYDYTHHRQEIGGEVGIEYHSQLFDLEAHITLGEMTIYRDGHYEKERFAGSLSWGESQHISLSTYNTSIKMGYAIATQHNVSLHLSGDRSAPLSRYLFVADQNSNRTIDNPTAIQSLSASLKYQYSTSRIRCVVEGYITHCADITQVWQGYDDISSTYCDVVITNIATRSLGVEASIEANVTRNLRLNATLAVGGYTYSSSPTVTLYDDTDMSIVAESRVSTLKGYIVGNAPQLTATASATYYFKKGVSIDCDLFYYAYRYTSPSLIRRTDRVISSMSSTEMASEILTQEMLPSLLNAHLAVIKSFRLANNTSLVALVKCENFLGGNNIITSAREANRVLGSSMIQPSVYEYSAGRSFYISLGYKF